ncbi:MAG: hypothetical protein ABFD64_10665 [Armatimonadota bacterium]
MIEQQVLFAVLITLFACGAAFSKATSSDDDEHELNVQIINKAKLSPERLADAINAKAVLTNNPKLLAQSAKLVPTDPVYIFQPCLWKIDTDLGDLAQEAPSSTDCEKLMQDVEKRKQGEVAKARKLLDKVYLVSPNYLPALYLDALNKPTLEEKLAALEKIAEIDKDNAKPYYNMAELKFGSLTRGKRTTEESSNYAFPLTTDELKDVLDLIRKGNAEPALITTLLRVPSVENIKVSIKGKVLPKEAVESMLMININEDEVFRDVSQINNAIARQISRQISWEAKQLALKDRKDEALDLIDVGHAFADNVAAEKPYRGMPFLVGSGMHSILRKAESDILDASADKDRLAKLKKQEEAWKNGVTSFQAILGQLIASPKDLVHYISYNLEESTVADALKKLNLIN